MTYIFWDYDAQLRTTYNDLTQMDQSGSVPEPWKRPVPPRKPMRRPDNKERMKNVVVSIVANQRTVSLDELGRRLDDIVATHCFPVRVS